jgi:hypothetical protein
MCAGDRAHENGELSERMEWALSMATSLHPSAGRMGQTTPESNETSQE